MTDTAVSESYVTTVEAATAFLAKRLGAAAWTAATSANQIAALQEATALIDALPLRGERYEPIAIYNGVQKDVDADGLTQTLEFPRVIDRITCDYDLGTQKPIVPQKVKDACCWIALALLEENSSSSPISEKELQANGVQSFSLGKLSMTFNTGAVYQYSGLPKKAYDLLKDYIDTTAGIG